MPVLGDLDHEGRHIDGLHLTGGNAAECVMVEDHGERRKQAQDVQSVNVVRFHDGLCLVRSTAVFIMGPV